MGDTMHVWAIPKGERVSRRFKELEQLWGQHIGDDISVGVVITGYKSGDLFYDLRVWLKESEQLWTDSAVISARWREEDAPNPAARLSSMRYRDYLQTPEWKATAKRKRQQAGNRCQVCNASGVQLDVHHRTYANRGHELDEDLIVLCHECHGIFESAGKLKVGND